MSRRFNDRPVTDTTPLSSDTMNSLIVPLDVAIAALEEVRFSWEEQVTLLNTNGLKRISEALKPLLNQIQSAISGSLLAATTDDLVELVEGETITFYVPPGARVAFLPTPFLSITAPDVLNDWALSRLISYDSVTGLLRTEILYLNGSGAERSGWTISDSAGVVQAVGTWMNIVLSAKDETVSARDEAVQAAEDTNAAAILIAGGPVSSVNGATGAITGVAMEENHYTKTQVDDALEAAGEATGEALGFKADAADVTTSLAALDNRATELTGDFVASGAIGNGKFVVLRSDGKVEEVAGSALAGSTGAAVRVDTSGEDVIDAQYNAATSKIAILRKIGSTYSLVIGTVSGSTITLGTPVNFPTTSSNQSAKIAWRADGSKIAVFISLGSSSQIVCAIATITGTAVVFGTFQGYTGDTGNSPVKFLVWESVGDRIILACGNSRLVACTVSGTVITFGANVELYGNTGVIYVQSTARIVGWNTDLNGWVHTGTLSGTTWTMGTQAVSPFGMAGRVISATTTGELLGITSLVASGPYHVYSTSYSGTTVTFSATVKLSDLPSSEQAAISVAYSSQDNKFVISHSETNTRSSLVEGTKFYVATITAGSPPTISAPTSYPDVFTVSTFAFTSDGIAVCFARMTSKLGVEQQIAGAIQGTEFILSPVVAPSPSGADQVLVLIPGKMFRCYLDTNRYVALVTLPTYVGNSHKWIGVAGAAAVDGAAVPVRLNGAVVGGQSGLTIGATYYLAPNGTISANDNGHKVGVAISATKLRLAA